MIDQFRVLSIIVMLSLPLVASADDLSWYAGVSAGPSSLRPDTENSAFELDSSVSAGAGVFIGYDLSQRFSVEGSFYHLGSATLSGANRDEDIGYTALSAGALFYIFGDADDMFERRGLTGFARLGLSSIDNETDIPLDQADNVAVWIGAGVDWAFSRHLNLRGEVTSFDGDAQALRLSVLYRPRASSSRSSAPSKTAPPVATAPTQNSVPQPIPRPVPQRPVQPSTQPLPQVAEQPRSSDCAVGVLGEPVGSLGCPLFSGPIRGVEFASGTANLTPIAQQLLDRVAANLIANPQIRVEIQAHTESFGNVARANNVARQRTIAVARHLAGRGVPVAQLQARAFGHSQPIQPDNTTGGRRVNNRIELKVIQ